MPLDQATTRARLRLAVDIGGTFTDLAAFDEAAGELRFGKALSTHGQLVDGIQDTWTALASPCPTRHLFLHGSTIAINTLLERTGREDRLLITEGFRDIYEIGRVNRPDAYNLFFNKHVAAGGPLARASRCTSGCSPTARSTSRSTRASARRPALPGARQGVEAVAILLLHSYRNPAHEVRVKQIVQEELPGAFVSASHELSQEYREFERVSTVAANAYVGPRVATYLGELSRRTSPATTSAAPSSSCNPPAACSRSEHARRDCVRMLESRSRCGRDRRPGDLRTAGPGRCHRLRHGRHHRKGRRDLCEGKPLTTGRALIGGYDQALPIQIPMIDIFEVGTGGGSIARLETGQRAARRAAERGLHARPRLLRARRHGADRDGCQPPPRPARSRTLSRRREWPARPRRRGARHEGEDRRTRSGWRCWPRPMASCASPSPPCPTP